MAELKTYFKLLRISDWRGYFLMGLFGLVVSKGFLFPLKDVLLFFAVLVLLLAFGFAVNDCFDAEEDKMSLSKQNPLTQDRLEFRKSLAFSVVPGILGLGLSWFFGAKVFLFCAVGALIGFFYSAPPLRFKSRPVLDLVSHGFFAGVFIIALPFLIFSKELTLPFYSLAFVMFYLSVTLELRNHLEDYESDRSAGVRTSVVAMGYEKSKKLLDFMALFYPFAVLASFVLLPAHYIVLFSVLSLLFLFLLVSRRESAFVKNYRLMDAYTAACFVLMAASVVL